jgi:hypothetical protein
VDDFTIRARGSRLLLSIGHNTEEIKVRIPSSPAVKNVLIFSIPCPLFPTLANSFQKSIHLP